MTCWPSHKGHHISQNAIHSKITSVTTILHNFMHHRIKLDNDSQGFSWLSVLITFRLFTVPFFSRWVRPADILVSQYKRNSGGYKIPVGRRGGSWWRAPPPRRYHSPTSSTHGHFVLSPVPLSSRDQSRWKIVDWEQSRYLSICWHKSYAIFVWL